MISADYEIEVRTLENNPAGLDRTEIERVAGNQYNSLFRQQHDSKALSASGSTTTVDRGEKKRKPRNRFEGNCLNCGRKGHRAKDGRSAKKRSKNQEIAANKKSGGRESATSVRVRRTLSINTVACRNLEHRTRNFVQREAEKGAILAKINVPVNAEVGLTAATTGAARGDGK